MKRAPLIHELCCAAGLLAAVLLWCDVGRAADEGVATAPAPELKEEANSLGMQLVLIPAGEFTMGSAPGEWGRGRNEAPQRLVRITRPFLMSRGETTNGQFMAFIEATNYSPIPLL